MRVTSIARCIGRKKVVSGRTRGHTASICLISHAVPVLPRQLYGFVYSLHPGRRGLTFSMVFGVARGNRIGSSHVIRAIVGSSHHFACRRTRRVVRAGRKSFGRRMLALSAVTGTLHRGHFSTKTVGFSHCRIGFRVSRGKGPVDICFGRSGSTGGLMRRFVLLTGEAMTRGMKHIPGGGGTGILPCHVRSLPSPRGLRGLSRFVTHFNCGMHADNAGASVSGSVGRLLSSVRNGGRRGLVRAISVHTVRGTHCSARGVNRCKLTFRCCARFASPVHHFPSVVMRHLLAGCVGKKHDMSRTGCRSLYSRDSGVRRVTTGTRHTSVGCGRMRFVDRHLKRVCSNMVSNMAR